MNTRLRRMMIIPALLLLLCSVFAFAACGGGGESNNAGGGSKGNTHTVYCYKSEDGSAAQEIKVGSEKGNTIAPAKKAHYKFLGYYTAEGTQVFGASGKQVEGLLIDRDVTVYARFEPIEYTVTFVVGEGTLPEGTATSVKIHADAWILAAPVPTAPLQTLQFEGWYNKDFTTEYVGAHGTVDYTKFSLEAPLGIVNNEIKLYAKYDTRTVKVTVDYNDYVTPSKEFEVVYGHVLGSLTEYEIDDEVAQKEIVGFSTSRYEMVPHTGPLTEDITVYAIWKNYTYITVHYESFDDERWKVYDEGVNGAGLPNPKKPGFRLDGLYTSPSYAGNPVTYVSFHSLASEYWAKLSLAEYTLTFVTGVADVAAPSPMHYFYGDVRSLPELSRLGYNFLGWSLERDGTGEVIYEIPEDFYADYTLYAVFEAESYVVELKGNGGTVSSGEEPVSYGSSYQLSVPTRTGYTFLGWFDGTGEDATQYTNARGISLADWTRTEGMTLYAHWQITTYTVRLDLKGGSLSGTKSWTYEYGSVLEIPEKFPIKSGLMFDGWYNADYTKEYVGAVVVTENLTLTAKWVQSKAISNVEGLKNIAANPAGTYHLTADINLLGETWTPIAEFTGTLNGNGHKIYAFSLSLNVAAGNYKLGFINVNKGTVRNLVLDEVTLNCVQSTKNWSDIRMGALIAENSGNVLNCHITNSTIKGAFTTNDVDNGTYSDTVWLGSIAGVNYGSLISCTSAATINANMTMAQSYKYYPTTTGDLRVGGIAGVNCENATVSNCTYTGELYATHVVTGQGRYAYAYGNGAAGGILAHNDAGAYCIGNSFSGSVYIGQAYNVTGNYNNGPHTSCDIGGIAAFNGGEISQCRSVGIVHSQTHRNAAGGLVSVNSGKISNSYSTATVIANGGNLHTFAGGFVAQNQGSIRMCYAAGSVTAEYTYRVGGFVGHNAETGTIGYCYAATDITLGAANENCVFVDQNDGTITSSACAEDITYTAGGTAVSPVGRSGVTLKSTAAEIYAQDHLFNTLYFETTSWKITGEAHPTLFFEK